MALPFLAPIASAATKALLGVGGKSALRYVARNFLGGAAFQAGEAISEFAMQWLSDRIDGAWDSNDPGPQGPGYTGCQAVTGGYLIAEVFNDVFQPFCDYFTVFGKMLSIDEFYLNYDPVSNSYFGRLKGPAEIVGGYIDTAINSRAACGGLLRTRINYADSGPDVQCINPAPIPPPPPPAPFIYTDPVTACETVAEFLYWSVDEEGRPEPVFLYGPATSTGEIAYNPADAATGCWFQPVIGGGDGQDGQGNPKNPITIPSPGPGPDQPIFKNPSPPSIQLGASLALNEFWLTTGGAGGLYLLNPACPTSEQPEEPLEVEIPEASRLDSITLRSDALSVIDQGLKNFRQPTCKVVPVLLGDFRTISFRSTTVSPFGKSRLRKRFRYRSQAGTALDPLVDHWVGFSWEAGPVCVIHKGASWGTPQVWASSIDEGKRVIRYAGIEAGIDPDSVGEWIVSGSSSPRVGVSGTMEVDTSGGFYWITARDGSDERPLVAET